MRHARVLGIAFLISQQHVFDARVFYCPVRECADMRPHVLDGMHGKKDSITHDLLQLGMRAAR